MDTKHTDKTMGRDTFAGSAAGKAAWDPAEDTFWRGHYEREPYFQKDMAWDDYEPAYRYGWDWHKRHPEGKWEDFEHDMSSGWDNFKMKSRLKWEHAKHAAKAAWDRAVHGKKHHAEHH